MLLIALGVTIASAAPAQIASNGVREDNGAVSRSAHARPTGRIIVKWRIGAPITTSGRSNKASFVTGRALKHAGRITDTLEVLRTDEGTPQNLQSVVADLARDATVEYASVEYRRRIHRLPDDPLVADQWYFLGIETSALRADQAWDTTIGSDGTVVAVLDTGIRYEHPDLGRAFRAGKVLPGYDFISEESPGSFRVANDGNGRDADPSDPGDWVTVAEAQQAPFDEDCLSTPGEQQNSSWHGTRVAGLIGAATNNATGLAAAAWSTWILPLRVLGKCGGFDTDIIAAMRWAAGLSVAGVPNNPYPARIINLSLGGQGACTSAYQAAIDEVTALGVLIVASAGNEGGPTSAPANCNGVLAVAGLRHAGTKVGYSNVGSAVGISAPAGNCVTTAANLPCQYPITAPTNLGTTTPGTSGYTDQFNFNVGTSFSAPLVAGTAALMHSVNARLTPKRLIARLQQGATAFPANPNLGIPTCHPPTGDSDIQDAECYCTTTTCGAGMLNSSAAVTHALRPSAVIQVIGSIAPGQPVTLDGSQSAAACNRVIASHAWSVVASSSTPSPTLSDTDRPTTTVSAPVSGSFTIRLTVTDAQGAIDTADVTVNPSSSSTAATALLDGGACPTPIVVPQDAADPELNPGISNGGGGGGQLAWELLGLLSIGLARAGRSNKQFRDANEPNGAVKKDRRVE